MNTKTSRVLILILTTTAVLAGCNLPFGGAPIEIPPTQDLNSLAALTQQAAENAAQQTLTAPTATPLAPTPTQTPLPLETASPTTEPQPSLPTKIQFHPGGTISFMKGEIKAGQQITFTLEAGKGQTLIAVASSQDNQVYFEIKGLDDGVTLTSFGDQSSSLTTRLPGTQAYQITLTSPIDSSYFLSLEVPANLTVSVEAGPVVVEGFLVVMEEFYPDAPTRVRYLIELEAGRSLNVQLNSQAINDLALALIGAGDRQPYLRHVVQATALNDFAVTVSQGYYLDVYSITGKSADFTLEIEVGE